MAAGIESAVDDLILSLRSRLGKIDPLQIVPYRTYGTNNRLYIKGRVLEENPVKKSSAVDSIWMNLLSMYQRFESDEIPGAKLKITIAEEEFIIQTDQEGYFVMDIHTATILPWEDMWQEVSIELVDAPVAFKKPLVTTGQVLVPQPDAEYGIISDIDDTIVKTGATSLLAMSRNTFFHNAHTRLPFAGVKEFYKSLQLGRNGKRNNPFFYVSSSPWNLYDLLIDFMDLNEIPEGPLLLRDFGLNQSGTPQDHMGHKFKEIENILNTYPRLPFVLIGDSGQEDPNIYREVVKKFPDRILAIYIRDVQLRDREKVAMDISKELLGEKVEMVIVDNTVEAAEHAAKNHLIFREAIPEIIEDKKQDKGEVAGKEELKAV
jgi:phosphatidate phosphatase APP1